jgi:hypothetical protein
MYSIPLRMVVTFFTRPESQPRRTYCREPILHPAQRSEDFLCGSDHPAVFGIDLVMLFSCFLSAAEQKFVREHALAGFVSRNPFSSHRARSGAWLLLLNTGVSNPIQVVMEQVFSSSGSVGDNVELACSDCAQPD